MEKLAMAGGPRTVPRERRIPSWPVVTEKDQEAVQRVMDSGRFTSASSGEHEIDGLERDWAQEVGTRYCVAVSNGTTALSLALAAAGIGPGSEVIVPALSFIASAIAPLHVAATPVFADINPVSFNVDPAAVEAAVTPRTRAILVVHLHGLPADLTKLMAVARRHGLILIEDAAQAHGARYQGTPVGSFGAVNAFSLNVSKNLATCGEGGLITTNDEDLQRKARMMRQFGEVIPDQGARSYVSHMLGWNHKPNAIQCAFTRSQLARFHDDGAARDDNVRHFLGRLGELPWLTVPCQPDDRTHVWHILRLCVDPEAFGLGPECAGPLRAAVMRALRAEGVPASFYQMMPLPSQRLFHSPPNDAGGLYRADAFPVTLDVIDRSFTIQKAHLHPDAGPLLDLYADAAEKIWEHRDVIAGHASAMARAYRPPWQEAEAIADKELALRYGSDPQPVRAQLLVERLVIAEVPAENSVLLHIDTRVLSHAAEPGACRRGLVPPLGRCPLVPVLRLPGQGLGPELDADLRAVRRDSARRVTHQVVGIHHDRRVPGGARDR
jgi:dTDP-4-amino-4,6-dideoxygalactose transaminase